MATPGSSRVQTLRIIAYATMSALVVLGIAISLVLPGLAALRPLWGWGAMVVSAISMASLLPVIGYRLPALSPTEDPATTREQGLQRYQAAFFLRLALAESVAIVGLGLAFAVPEGGLMLYGFAALASLSLLAVHVVPHGLNVRRCREALESQGARSDLVEALGVA